MPGPRGAGEHAAMETFPTRGMDAAPPATGRIHVARAALATALAAALATLAPTAPARDSGLMLATSPAGETGPIAHPAGEYWVSEKLDGVRARWDGRRLWTRGGLPVEAPAWFTAGWPAVAMDGELWMGRGRFEATSSLVRNPPEDEAAWRTLRFLVFDLPGHGGRFGERVLAMRALAGPDASPWLRPVAQSRVAGRAQLEARLKAVLDVGGEGLMLHHDRALYLPGRNPDLLKLKPHDDAEARVVAHLAGRGKYTGMTGALLVEREDGARFRLGSGLSDAERADPPPVGSLVTYRYNGLTVNGLPRFPRYLRIREDSPLPPQPGGASRADQDPASSRRPSDPSKK